MIWDTRHDPDRIRGDARIYWGKITDSDWEQIAGDKNRLLDKLQERYGWSREQARREVALHFGK
jgi:uncharacterized protein YjbJ (UPF0337 family)